MPSANKQSFLLYSAAGALLVAAILTALNIISSYAHVRLDLSRGRIFSITPATRKILSVLPDPAIITLYSSRELPPQVSPLRSYVRDLLREYQSAGGGKVKVKFVELGDSQEEQDTASKNGVMAVSFDTYSHDKFEQRDGYFGLTIQFRDKKDVIPYLNTSGALEYELTSRIQTLALAEKPQLGFVTGHYDTASPSLSPDIITALDSRFTVQTVDLSALDPKQGIAPEIKTLVLLGGSGQFSDKELFLLEQYLLSGRNLLVAVDTKHINTADFTASPAKTNLPRFLAEHGVTVRPELIMDEQAQPIQLGRYQGNYLVNNVIKYPPFAMVTGLNRANPATKGIPAVVMPFCSPVEPSTAAVGGQIDVLLTSSRDSWLADQKSGVVNIDPFKPDTRTGAQNGPFLMGLVLTNKFAATYTAPPKGIIAPSYLKEATGQGRLAVLGTSAFIAPSYGMPSANNLFFLNLVDWLSQDADLITIRSKDVSFMPLEDLSDSGKRTARYALIFLPPLGAVLIGLFMWKRRIAAKEKAARTYGGA